MNYKIVASFLTTILMLSGCDLSTGSNDTNPTIDLKQSWETSSPESEGINSTALSNAVSEAASNLRFLSLIVVRNGKLVLEEYFNGNSSSTLNDVRSVTKSIVSMLTGIALQKGFIDSLNQSIIKYLPERVSNPEDPVFADITIKHLLTMTSGFQYDENTGDSYSEWILSEDKLKHLFELPHINTPGSTFTYNSAAVHLLGAIVQEASGIFLPDFADQYLFNKIGIDNKQWEDFKDGFVNGGAGIDLRPRDLARLGQLFLQNGISGETRVIPADWANESTTPQFSWRISFGPLKNLTYSYLWWNEESNTPAFLAWGYGGQFIYVVPSLNLVVVTTTNWHGVSQDGGPAALEQAALNIILNGIIPAVH